MCSSDLELATPSGQSSSVALDEARAIASAAATIGWTVLAREDLSLANGEAETSPGTLQRLRELFQKSRGGG